MAAYDSQRIEKIAKIMSSFLDFSAVGDEVYMGLEGDPCLPTVYRGAERPEGLISRITGQPGAREVEITLKGSGTKVYHREFDTQPTRTFEFTDAGYRGVLERAKAAAAARNPSAQPYRGVEGATQIKGLEDKLNMMHNTFVKMASGFAQDMTSLAAQMKMGEPTFSGALVREMTAYRNANSQGSPNAHLDDDAVSAVSSFAAARRPSSPMHFNREDSLISQ